MRTQFLLVALALLIWAQQEPPPSKPTATQARKFSLSDNAQAATIEEGIQGAWQLQHAENPMIQLSRVTMTGYAIFREGYMALEIHGQGQVQPGFPGTIDYFFQTGVHRYQINGQGQLETFSLIGTTNMMDVVGTQFEVPGQRRSFDVSLQGNSLVLEKGDGGRLTFFRLGTLPFPGQRGNQEEFDMFGRRIPKAAEDADGKQEEQE